MTMENFNMYKKLEHICSNKNTIINEITKYGLDNGVDFSCPSWRHKLLNFDVSNFSLVEKHTTIIEYLGIDEIEEKFVNIVCNYYFFEKKLCETLDDDIMRFFCRHWIFSGEGKWLLNWKNYGYAKKITDIYLIKLNEYLQLKNLDIPFNEKVTNDGVKCLTDLTRLSIWDTKVTDDGIKNLTKLTILHANGTEITDEGSKGKHLTNLTTLNVCCTNITDESVKYLTNLTNLNIQYTCVTDEGSRGKFLTKLTTLHAPGTKITDEGSKGKQLTKLTALEANYTKITDDSIKCLINLTSLGASDTKITDEGIKYLKNLTYLQASDTKITDEGIKCLT
jgi:hypothetical protein